MQTIVWQGIVDNLELSGVTNGDQQPMRVVDNEEGRLMTEYAADSETEDGGISYDTSRWISDYQRRFRDMQPPPEASLRLRMIEQNLLDA
jgi:hypothetical protein